jgi:hypothetical protein
MSNKGIAPAIQGKKNFLYGWLMNIPNWGGLIASVKTLNYKKDSGNFSSWIHLLQNVREPG